jgi:DNA-binding ferritin-like protein
MVAPKDGALGSFFFLNQMHNLATLFRAAQLTAHEKHNTVQGPTFFEDHEYLGDLYGTYESAYDSVIERMIGLGETPKISEGNIQAADLAKWFCDLEPIDKWPNIFLEIETRVQKEVDSCCKGSSSGTLNFLQGLADESEQRVYKLGQRAKCDCGSDRKMS